MRHNDLEALKLLKEWTTWLVAIETAAIGAIGVGIKDVHFTASCSLSTLGLACNITAKIVATAVVVLFGLSIIAALYLLLALPAIAQRLPPPPQDDVYMMWTVGRGRHYQLFRFVQVVRWTSLPGFICFAALVLLIVWASA